MKNLEKIIKTIGIATLAFLASWKMYNLFKDSEYIQLPIPKYYSQKLNKINIQETNSIKKNLIQKETTHDSKYIYKIGERKIFIYDKKNPEKLFREITPPREYIDISENIYGMWRLIGEGPGRKRNARALYPTMLKIDKKFNRVLPDDEALKVLPKEERKFAAEEITEQTDLEILKLLNEGKPVEEYRYELKGRTLKAYKGEVETPDIEIKLPKDYLLIAILTQRDERALKKYKINPIGDNETYFYKGLLKRLKNYKLIDPDHEEFQHLSPEKRKFAAKLIDDYIIKEMERIKKELKPKGFKTLIEQKIDEAYISPNEIF